MHFFGLSQRERILAARGDEELEGNAEPSAARKDAEWEEEASGMHLAATQVGLVKRCICQSYTFKFLAPPMPCA